MFGIFIPEPGPPPERARECSLCKAQPKRVVWRHYRSDEQSFMALAGREGYIASCSKHPGIDVYEEWTLVS